MQINNKWVADFAIALFSDSHHDINTEKPSKPVEDIDSVMA